MHINGNLLPDILTFLRLKQKENNVGSLIKEQCRIINWSQTTKTTTHL